MVAAGFHSSGSGFLSKIVNCLYNFFIDFCFAIIKFFHAVPVKRKCQMKTIGLLA